MPYLGVVTDWFDDWDFNETDMAEDVFEDMQAKWKPNNRFTIQKLLGSDVPDFMLWIQDQIDDVTTDETPVFDKEEHEIDGVKQYIKSEIILEPENNINSEFEDISRILKEHNRPALDKVFRRNKEEFLGFLRSRLSEQRDESETDEEIGELESTVESLERSIENILQPAIQGLANLLGTPIRIAEEQVLPVIAAPVKVIEKEIAKTGIIESIKGFIRGLFS